MAKCLYFRQTMANNGNNSNDNNFIGQEDNNIQHLGLNDPPGGSNNPMILSPNPLAGLWNEINQVQMDPSMATNMTGPSLSDAILETDIFLRSIGINDNDSIPGNNSNVKNESNSGNNNYDSSSEQQIPTPSCSSTSMDSSASSCSTNISNSTTNPIWIPPSTTGGCNSRNNNPMMYTDTFSHNQQGSTAFSDLSSNASSVSDSGSWSNNSRQSLLQSEAKHTGMFRSLATGLDPVPEDGVTNPPTVYQPLVPPPISKPMTTSYNISFPTTLQPGERFDIWSRSGAIVQPPCTAASSSQMLSGYTSAEASIPPSPGSLSSRQSPYHGIAMSTPPDLSECQPVDVIKEENAIATNAMMPILPIYVGGSSMVPSGATTPRSGSKRSRWSRPPSENGDEEDNDGATSRQRRRSANAHNASSSSGGANVTPNEKTRRDSIKLCLDELQRVLPIVGSTEQYRVSQASILHEGGKYIKDLKTKSEEVNSDIEAVKKKIDELNNQIEDLQNELPVDGAPLLPKVLTVKTLPDQFHDHVINRTKEDWRYWVFVSIMGHFVHSFEDQVSAANMDELQATSLDYVSNNLNLQQLRKDAYRKLAKLCAKTSIVEDPSKLPDEALAFVSRGDRAFKQEEKS